MHKLFGLGLLILFAAAPSSTNFTLKSYSVGSSGSAPSTSTNYQLNGVGGEQSGTLQTSSSYATGSGVINTETANVPPAPTFTNPGNYYSKLQLVVQTGNNPADTKYLIGISSDSFATTNYVQTDDSIGSSQAITNYQTYASWGGASGFYILGLSQSTTYQVKIKALQGNFTGSNFSPTASASTVAPSLSMTLATTASSTPPFLIGFSNLLPSTVTASSADISVTISSNAGSGGGVYIRSANAGLTSSSAGTSITSATTDLSSASSGYGALVISTSQASGSPVTAQSPFNLSANNVGGLTTNLQAILTTTGAVSTGNGQIRLLAKAGTTTAPASDYADTVTLISVMIY